MIDILLGGRNSHPSSDPCPVTPDTLDGTAAFSTQRSLFLTDNNLGITSQHALTVTDMSVTAEVMGRGGGGGGGGVGGGGGGEDEQGDPDQVYRHENNQSLLNLLFNIAEDQAKKGERWYILYFVHIPLQMIFNSIFLQQI